jgi:hypothetical protein
LDQYLSSVRHHTKVLAVRIRGVANEGPPQQLRKFLAHPCAAARSAAIEQRIVRSALVRSGGIRRRVSCTAPLLPASETAACRLRAHPQLYPPGCGWLSMPSQRCTKRPSSGMLNRRRSHSCDAGMLSRPMLRSASPMNQSGISANVQMEPPAGTLSPTMRLATLPPSPEAIATC